MLLCTGFLHYSKTYDQSIFTYSRLHHSLHLFATHYSGAPLREEREMKLGGRMVVCTPKTKRFFSRYLVASWLLMALLGGFGGTACAQTDADKNPNSASPSPGIQYPDFSPTVRLQSLPRNLFMDQKDFWTVPLHMPEKRWQWAVPVVLAGAALIADDTNLEKHAPKTPATISHASTASNVGLAAIVGAGGGLFVLGHLKADDQKRETGLLSGEAAIDALVQTEILKYAAGRNRPYEGDGQGRFFQGGSSFPSAHASTSFAIASVIAHEYPGPLTQLLAYGLAGGISAARFAGQKHFMSDVVIGGAMGWYTGRQVFRSHSRYSDADIAKYGTFNKGEKEIEETDAGEKPRRMASPYIPLDSWVYPAVEKLATLASLNVTFMSSRPWTRLEVANLLHSVKDRLQADEAPAEEISSLEDELEQEFAYELGLLDGKSNKALRVESVYTRVTGISGQPLNDSYHFGQTIVDNFGRPYQKGFNTYDGISGYATAGRFAIYVRGEYQHSPSAPGYSLAAREAIAAADQNPLQPYAAIDTVNHFTLLDTYATVNAAGWNLSFGKESLWWGPADGGALMFSDNAEPIYMFRGSRTIMDPPWILHRLGAMKIDLFFGKLSGNQFPPRPLIHGEKITFHPTPNMEASIDRTSELGGVGRALTAGAIWESYVGLKSSFEYPANRDPGKRTLGFDFTYRVPHLRNWVRLYGEGLLPVANPFNLDNSHNPIYDPARTAVRTGVYLPKLPRIPHLDLHIESVYTDPPTPRSTRGDYIYWDGIYKDLYTNKNNLIGDWIGREGTGFQAWSNYWFTARSSLQVNYRHAKVAKDFIPSGETLNDGSAKLLWWFHRDISLSGSVQYEQWLAPILASTPQTNWTSTVEITFWPRFLSH